MYDIWATVNWASLSAGNKAGHTLITVVGLVCDIIICIACASNPFLSAMLPASQIMRDMVRCFYDWCSGNITTEMFKTSLCADFTQLAPVALGGCAGMKILRSTIPCLDPYTARNA